MRDNEKARGIKDALCNLLDGIEGGGSFATSGAFAGAPLPDLSLKGYGPIPLPLAQRDTDAICKEHAGGDEGKGCIELQVAASNAKRMLCRKCSSGGKVRLLGA